MSYTSGSVFSYGHEVEQSKVIGFNSPVRATIILSSPEVQHEMDGRNEKGQQASGGECLARPISPNYVVSCWPIGSNLPTDD
jgi:hypothetical protein